MPHFFLLSFLNVSTLPCCLGGLRVQGTKGGGGVGRNILESGCEGTSQAHAPLLKRNPEDPPSHGYCPRPRVLGPAASPKARFR